MIGIEKLVVRVALTKFKMLFGFGAKVLKIFVGKNIVADDFLNSRLLPTAFCPTIIV